ncbi:unnamed protein product, partial [Rotaria magnacalcarata]
MNNVEARLNLIPVDNFLDAITVIDESLPEFDTSIKRLELFKKKLEFQRKYLRM